jgi:hypothetical protein
MNKVVFFFCIFVRFAHISYTGFLLFPYGYFRSEFQVVMLMILILMLSSVAKFHVRLHFRSEIILGSFTNLKIASSYVL